MRGSKAKLVAAPLLELALQSIQEQTPKLFFGACMVASAALGGLVFYAVGHKRGIKEAPNAHVREVRQLRIELAQCEDRLESERRVVTHMKTVTESALSALGNQGRQGV